MKKEKGKIKVGGFELFCLIIFAWPLLFIPMFLSSFREANLSLSQMLQSPLLMFIMLFLIFNITLLIYNLYKPLSWINIKIKDKWKLCAVLSLIIIVISLINPLIGNASIGYFIMKFVSGCIYSFLTFTGANTLALFIQGKATFNTKK